MERFTKDQIKDYNTAFNMFDRYKRGYIQSTELREMLKLIGYNPTDKLLETLTITIDIDGNGQVDFPEFIDLIDKLEDETKNTKEAQDAFNCFDFMGEGHVSSSEIKDALMYIMEEAPEADKINITKHFQLDNERKITFEEFKQMVMLN